ncbi:BnaC01g35520D [Brassica napus]|uniref:BnaC01g35520D protein n=1 Tax=Brassica napus TaxID=3708 RepID=A0A078GTC5_BRANA|nr:BnaC01g35520D [Brassica napus]
MCDAGRSGDAIDLTAVKTTLSASTLTSPPRKTLLLLPTTKRTTS